MASQMAADIGTRIAQARNAKGITQKQLGNLLSGIVGGDQVSKWERGTHRPHDDTLLELARALDVELAWLVGGDASEDTGPQQTQASAVVIDTDAVLQMLEQIRAEQRELQHRVDLLLEREDPRETIVAEVKRFADRVDEHGSRTPTVQTPAPGASKPRRRTGA